VSIPHPPGCPACGSAAALRPREEHLDPIGGKRYRLLDCPACGVTSSEPREPVGADWYEKERPTRARETRPAPESDWRFRQFFSERLAPGRLLDVGCGDGGFLALAAARGFVGTGFDYDERMVAKARARGIADAHAAEFADFCRTRRDGEFDYAVLFDVLEHTPEPAWFFGEVRRLLKPGGHVALTMPNALRPVPLGREEYDYPPHHFTRWTPDALKGFLERGGFEVARLDAGTLKTTFLSDVYFFRAVMPRLLALARRLLFGRAAPGATLTQLYEGAARPSPLSDKLRRQELVEAARRVFAVLFYPAALILRARFLARDPRCGEYLYVLARLKESAQGK